eukprot:gene9624-14939_t
MRKDPSPYITAHPEETNLLTWHYTVEGPPGSPYEGGLFHGKLVFPEDFPYNPPSVYMCTPNGRFRTGERLCLSMSDFHPKEWNPMWTVSSILTGLLSFMVDDTITHGSVLTTDDEKRALARESLAYNLRNPTWVSLFPEQADECKERLARIESQKKLTPGSSTASAAPSDRQPGSLSAADSVGMLLLVLLCAIMMDETHGWSSNT